MPPMMPPSIADFLAQGMGAGSQPAQQPMGMPAPVDYSSLFAQLGVGNMQPPVADEMGRYGITEAQNKRAEDRSMGGVLMGAAQSIFSKDPRAVMAAGLASGGVRDSMLDEASKANQFDYQMRMKDAMNRIDMMGKMSDIDLQKTNIKMNEEKLSQMQLEKEIAKKWGEAMVPAAQGALAEFEMKYPEQKDTAARMRAGLVAVGGLLASGDVQAADTLLNHTMENSPEWFQQNLSIKMIQEQMNAAANIGMTSEMMGALQNEINESPALKGYQIAIGPNGQPLLKSPADVAEDQAKIGLANSQATENNARARALNSKATAEKKLDPKQLVKDGVMISKAASTFMQLSDTLRTKPPVDLKARATMQNELSKAQATLEAYGVAASDPESLKSVLTVRGAQERARQVATSAYALALGYAPGATSGPTEASPAAPAAPLPMMKEQALGLVMMVLKAGRPPEDLAANLPQLINTLSSQSPEVAALIADLKKRMNGMDQSDPSGFLMQLAQELGGRTNYINPNRGPAPLSE